MNKNTFLCTPLEILPAPRVYMDHRGLPVAADALINTWIAKGLLVTADALMIHFVGCCPANIQWIWCFINETFISKSSLRLPAVAKTITSTLCCIQNVYPLILVIRGMMNRHTQSFLFRITNIIVKMMLRLDLWSAIDYTLSQRRITNARPRIFRHYRMCRHTRA